MNKIKQLREEKGMTQSQLGEILNVQGAAISKYENEKIPLTTEAIKILSQFFNVSADYLLGKTDKEGELRKAEPVCSSSNERNVLNIFREYEKHGLSDELESEIKKVFPELKKNESGGASTEQEKKLLGAFRELDEDNQDILIGEAKKMLRDQRLEESVAADSQLKAAK